MVQGDDVPLVTLGDLGKLAAGFRSLLTEVDAVSKSHLSDRRPWRVPSQAATDAGSVGGTIEDMLGLVNIRIAAALDNGDALTKMAETAVAGTPTPTFPASSVARSAIEYLAVAHWLESGVDAIDRAARHLSIARQEIVNQQRLGADLSEALEETEQEATTLGLELVGRQGRRGFSEEIASRTSMVQSVLGDEDTYALLSAASHGDTWALVTLGYKVSATPSAGTGWGILMTKEPSVLWFYNALLRTMQAIARCAWRDTQYRGWGVQSLEKKLGAAFDLASLAVETRSWPSSS